MWIKWRTYQRQKYGQKGDKYRLQPILMVSYRRTKQRTIKSLEDYGFSRDKAEKIWKEIPNKNMPCQMQLYRFPPFASCDYVHYREPNFIENRLHYWEWIDIILDENPCECSDADKQKIIDEIESILPRPYGELLEILEQAYTDGMDRTQSPKEIWGRNRDNVVPNNVSLHTGH